MPRLTLQQYFDQKADPIGNILTSPQGTYLYQGNQGSNFANPHAVTSVGSLGLSYDQNGNLTYRAGSEGISHFWDYNNRLTKITIPVPIFEGGMRMDGFEEIPPTTAYYTYDPAGMRITTNVWGSATTTYPTALYNTDGSKVSDHIVVNGVPVATVEKIGTGNPTIFWNSQDHLQSTSVVANQTAGIAEEVEYRSFGSLKSNTGPHKEQRKYTGHEYDNQVTTNYTYAKARYLNTDWGRFLSEDPGSRDNPDQFLADPQQLNMYSYARNNPLIFVDREGKKVELAVRNVTPLGGLHLFYILAPDNPNQININSLPKGTEQFTLGAYNPDKSFFGIGNKLRPDIGYIDDPTPNSDLPFLTGNKQIKDKITITPPNGQSDTQFINNLGKAFNEIGTVSYFSGGQIGKFGYANSNNFAYELGSRAGVANQVFSFDPKGFNPGSQRGIPQSTFFQYIQQRISVIQAQIDALRQRLYSR